MPVYDCRPTPEPGSLRFTRSGVPVNARVLDAATGLRIAHVFYLDTGGPGRPPRVARWVADADGNPMVQARRYKVWVPDGRGGKKLEFHNDRLEVWEVGRPWVAVACDTGEVLVRSEGAA